MPGLGNEYYGSNTNINLCDFDHLRSRKSPADKKNRKFAFFTLTLRSDSAYYFVSAEYKVYSLVFTATIATNYRLYYSTRRH